MKLGIAGYPQVGKKTLFSLLTGQTISEQRSNRQGLAPVGDPRFDRLVDLYHPQKETPAVVEFELLPDLDEDATRNAQALGALENVDAICHVVRAFNDEAVYHISGSVNAARDAQRRLGSAPGESRSDVLRALSRLLAEREPELLEANRRDLEAAQASDLAAPLLKRLGLTAANLRKSAGGHPAVDVTEWPSRG